VPAEAIARDAWRTVKAAGEAASRPAIQAPSPAEPLAASRPSSQPASRAAPHPGTQPASRPASQPAPDPYAPVALDLPRPALELFVSPSGDDNNPGTVEAPLATIVAARDAIRTWREARGDLPRGGVRVLLRGGWHLLRETVIFEADDSGRADAPIVYSAMPGETAIVSGAHAIAGWRRAGDVPGMSRAARGKLFVADIPQGWAFHYLYVNGRPQPRARRPDGDDPGTWPRLVAAGPPGREGQRLTFPAGALDDLPAQGVEACIVPGGGGGSTLSALTELNRVNATARRQSRNVTAPLRAGDPFRLENAPALLSRPGQWCVDAAGGKVYYWPAADSMDALTVHVSMLFNLVRFSNEEEGGRSVRHVHLRGLVLMHGGRMSEHQWPAGWIKRTGDNGEGLVHFVQAEDCSLERCRLFYAGAAGVSIEGAARRIRLVGNEIAYVGAAGVSVMGGGPGTARPSREHVISRNYIHHVGQAPYLAANGVVLYGAGDSLVSYNYLHDVPGGGIAMLGVPVAELNSRSRMADWTDAYGQFEPRYQVRWDELPPGSQDRFRDDAGTLSRQDALKYLQCESNLVARNLVVSRGPGLLGLACGRGNRWVENLILQAESASPAPPILLDAESGPGELAGNAAWSGRDLLNQDRQNRSDGNRCAPGRTPEFDGLLGRIVEAARRQGGYAGKPAPLAETEIPTAGQ